MQDHDLSDLMQQWNTTIDRAKQIVADDPSEFARVNRAIQLTRDAVMARLHSENEPLPSP